MTRPPDWTAKDLLQWARIPEGLADLLCRYSATRYVSIRKLRGSAREAYLVEARREFAALASEHGFSASAIGRALDRDHTTILHHLKIAA